MVTSNKIILVTGGTGKQGGAVAKNLSEKGFLVKVLTRDPGSTQARVLQKLGIDLVKGDLDIPESYRKHLKDIHGIFSVQSFEKGVDKEIIQGTSLASLAKASGVSHFLYSSVAGVQLNSRVPHFESKLLIENHIKKIGLPFTIIRPASFYENFLIPQVKKGILKGKFVQPIRQNTIMQYIASEDIGKAAAAIFQDQERYEGKTVPLATEQLTSGEVAQIFTRVLGKQVIYKRLPPLITRLFIGNSVYKMFRWMDEQNRFDLQDIENSWKEFPNPLRLNSWIEINFKADH